MSSSTSSDLRFDVKARSVSVRESSYIREKYSCLKRIYRWLCSTASAMMRDEDLFVQKLQIVDKLLWILYCGGGA